MKPFKKTLRPGTVNVGHGSAADLFVRVEWDGKKLSICGVEGPMRSGNARGSYGQCTESLAGMHSYADLWDADSANTLREIWERWHLNDMHPGCEHQRKAGWGSETVEVISYKLTSEARATRRRAIELASVAACNQETADLSKTEIALIQCEWFRDIYTPPDADSPLSGCYEVSKRESKRTGWVHEHEHPKGVLSKACPECGYKYGAAWLTEEVPEEVLEELMHFPDADKEPAWV